MSLFRKRRDKDFAWYQKQLGERLSEMQQRHSNPSFHHSHVVRDHGDYFAGELTDAAMVEVIEHVQNSPGVWKGFRAKLKAEQVRRREESERLLKRVTIATLVLTIIGIIVGAVF
jgi:hypothetical protein